MSKIDENPTEMEAIFSLVFGFGAVLVSIFSYVFGFGLDFSSLFSLIFGFGWIFFCIGLLILIDKHYIPPGHFELDDYRESQSIVFPQGNIDVLVTESNNAPAGQPSAQSNRVFVDFDTEKMPKTLADGQNTGYPTREGGRGEPKSDDLVIPRRRIAKES